MPFFSVEGKKTGTVKAHKIDAVSMDEVIGNNTRYQRNMFAPKYGLKGYVVQDSY